MRKTEVLSFLDFTFDLTSRDLMRRGMRLRVPEQTSSLLAILLERAGSVVTRDELQQLLWPNGDFLDHERAINRIVTHLRSVLRDDPRNPKFIETVHKRGYRFLPAVTVTSPSRQPDEGAARPEEQSVTLADSVSQPEPSVLLSTSSISSSIEPVIPQDLPADEDPPVLDFFTQPGRPFLAKYRRGVLFGVCTIVLVTVCGITALFVSRHHASSPKQDETLSLGLAPFQSEGPGAEQTGESFRLDLADALSQLPNVQIRATNSLSSAVRDDNSLKVVSEKLHLDVVLLGRLRIQGDRCIMQFELIRSRDFLHLASFQYEGGRDELTMIRDKLQRDLFIRLQGETKSAQAIRGSTENPQAYSEYLQARELTEVRDAAVLNQALTHYQKAIDLDPRFAQAYSGMATAHIALRYFDPADHQQKAQQLAEQALQLDPGLAEAHAVLGDIAFRSAWNFKLGESELRKAVELEPHKATYHAWLAGLLADEERNGEALEEINQGIADDPLWPSIYSMAAFVAGAARDNTRMLADVNKYLSLVPDSAYTHDQLAWAYFAANRYSEALDQWQRMAEMEKDPARIELEQRGRDAFSHGGILAYAHVRLDAIEHHTIDTTHHPNDFIPAEWYAFVGQPDKALPALQQIVANHDGEAVQLAINTMFDNLHDDPRFRALLRQIGLPQPNELHANKR